MPKPRLATPETQQPSSGQLAASLMRLARLDGDVARMIGRYDHVTRLPNRLQFLDDFAALRGDTAQPRLLVMVTLADARHYNEILRALGHAFSEDFVRAGIAQMMSMLPDMRVYHVSVLSFAFVLDFDGGVPAIAERIAQSFASDLRVNDIPIKSRVGIGLLPLEGLLSDPSEALRAALTAAQDSRRLEMGVAFYNNRTDAAHLRAFRILTDLPRAISARDELRMVFQPRIDLAGGRVHGAEALLRWEHPELGFIPPNEFVALAEQTSLITPLTDWVIEASLRQARQFIERGQALRISINASPANLSEPGFDEKLLKLCSSNGVGPEHVELEFTEGMLAGNADRASRQLEHLRDAGIAVAIDDFGTGFANLSYLSTVPADVLKIDQSLVMPMRKDSDFLVRHIIEIAHGLDFRVCAEGIETEETFDHLKLLGCDEGQGYYMARPMPAEAFYGWLDAEKPFAR